MKKLKKKTTIQKRTKKYTVISYRIKKQKEKIGKKDNTLNEKYFFTNPEKKIFLKTLNLDNETN